MPDTQSLDRLHDAGLLVIAAADLPTLYVELSSRVGFDPDIARATPLADPAWPIVWKPKGAIWSSPEVPARNPATRASAWTAWRDWDGYAYSKDSDPPTGGATLWEIHADPAAAVLVIRDDEDSHRLAELHPTTFGGFSFTALAAEGVDAIWATPRSFSLLHFKRNPHRPGDLRVPEPMLYGWDAETVCWINPAAITSATPHPRGIAADDD